MVQVPANARVFVNGVLTKTTGDNRRYISPGLIAGVTYKYEVRVEVPNGDKPITAVKTARLAGGDEQQLRFDGNAIAAGHSPIRQ